MGTPLPMGLFIQAELVFRISLAGIAHHLTQLCDVKPDDALDSVQRVIAELSTLDLVQDAPVEPM